MAPDGEPGTPGIWNVALSPGLPPGGTAPGVVGVACKPPSPGVLLQIPSVRTPPYLFISFHKHRCLGIFP
jgi:hypothetical protein